MLSTLSTPIDQNYEIVHHLPGRIRFRLPCLKNDPKAKRSVKNALEGLVGVTEVRINRSAQSVVVHYTPDETVEAQIRQKLGALVVQETKDKPSLGKKETAILAPSSKTSLSSGNSLKTLAFIAEEAAPSLALPGLAAVLALLGQTSRFSRLRPLALSALMGAAFPIAKRAFYSVVKERRLNIDCLDFLVVSLSAWQGKLVTPAMVMMLHELGDVIRDQTARVTQVQTTNLLDAIGRYAWVKYEENESPQKIESDRVKVGDLVIVYPGEQIPIDGIVLQGEAIIDQQGLTGESMPVVRREGDWVWASTLLRSGQLYLRAERVGEQTRAAASLQLLQKAPVHDTRMANYAEKIADRLIWPSLLLSTVVLFATRDPARAAALLTLDFVTGIRVSLPTAFLGALNHTTQHGILVRSGRTVEQLAEIDTVVFDKTGTLTQGTIAVVGVKTVESTSEEEVLRLAAAAEQRLNHPVAEAIGDYARQQGVNIPQRGEWSYEVGLGVQAEIEGRLVMVGSQRFLKQEGVSGVPENGFGGNGSESLIYVACDRIFQGVIQYADPLRPESPHLIETLQNTYKIDVYLLTGDNPKRAQQVAQELNISTDHVFAEAFPDEKARIVRELHRAGRTVAFVGDGLNDSVALAYADVSVSFAQGSEIARETADVVFMNNSLLDLLEAISIARQTRALIDQNITLVVAPNLMALGLASTMGLNPLVATAIHNGSAIAAGINSLRPLVEHQLE